MITINSSNFLIHNDNKDIFDIDIYKSGRTITIKNTHLVCPQFYFIKNKDGFILSTEHKLKINGKKIFEPVLNIKHSMWGINDKFTKMLNAIEPELPYKVITNWSEIVLTDRGELSVKPNDYSRLYSVDIQDAKYLIQEWKEKYSDLVSDYCKRNAFTPTLTGGCDTRILTYFWRDKDLKNYRLRAIKQDGKQNIEKGKIEIDIAEKIIDKLGKKMTRFEEPPEGTVSMCGTYTESTQYWWLLNDKQFITNVINKCNFEWYQLQPFTDDLYLMIKPHKMYEMRALFMLLFCPDLLDIEMISKAGHPPYHFEEEFCSVIDKCNSLIKKWGKI